MCEILAFMPEELRKNGNTMIGGFTALSGETE